MSGPTNTQFAVAVHAMLMLHAAEGESVSSAEIAGSAGVNPVYVRRVLGQLRCSGLVKSKPGVGGGWLAGKAACDTPLSEIWRILQDGAPILGFQQAAPDCPRGARTLQALRDLDKGVAAAVEKELSSTTLADIALPARAAPSP